MKTLDIQPEIKTGLSFAIPSLIIENPCKIDDLFAKLPENPTLPGGGGGAELIQYLCLLTPCLKIESIPPVKSNFNETLQGGLI